MQEVDPYLPLKFRQKNYRFSIKVGLGIFRRLNPKLKFNINAKEFWPLRIESMDDRMVNESVPLNLNYFFSLNCLIS